MIQGSPSVTSLCKNIYLKYFIEYETDRELDERHPRCTPPLEILRNVQNIWKYSNMIQSSPSATSLCILSEIFHRIYETEQELDQRHLIV